MFKFFEHIFLLFKIFSFFLLIPCGFISLKTHLNWRRWTSIDFDISSLLSATAALVITATWPVTYRTSSNFCSAVTLKENLWIEKCFVYQLLHFFVLCKIWPPDSWNFSSYFLDASYRNNLSIFVCFHIFLSVLFRICLIKILCFYSLPRTLLYSQLYCFTMK